MSKPARTAAFEFSQGEPGRRGSRSAGPRRYGFLILALLTLMTTSMALIFSSLSFSLKQQRQLVRHSQADQAAWLLDAGLARALSRWQQDPGYPGEAIELTSSFPRYHRAELLIQILPSTEAAPPTVQVSAFLSAGPHPWQTLRKSLRATLDESLLNDP